MEVELQYLYTGSAPPQVPALLATLPLGSSSRFLLVDRYFDTEDLALRRSGHSLRVRVADNDPAPRLTWKGPATRDGLRSEKRRHEIEFPVELLPGSGDELVGLLLEHGLWERICKASELDGGAALHQIGELRNRRSSHQYEHGLHLLELSWDHVEYPLGPEEVRLEVELKSAFAERYLEQADAELRALFGSDLTTPERGKVRELCE